MSVTAKDILNKYYAMPKAGRAALWFLICSFLQKGIRVISTPIFTRLLSTEEFGVYNVYATWENILILLISLNLVAEFYMQALVKFHQNRDELASSMRGLITTLVAGWTIIYILFPSFWNRLFGLTTAQMAAILILTWTGKVFWLWSSEQRVDLRYRRLVSLSLLVSVAKPIVGVLFVLHAEDKATAWIYADVLVEIVCYSGLFWSQMKRCKRFFSARFWPYALQFTIPLLPHYLSQSLLGSADRIMIRDMVGESQAGIYSLAYSVACVMSILSTAVNNSLTPWIFKKIRDQEVRKIQGPFHAAFLTIAAANLLLMAFAPEVVAIFAPPAYYDAIWVIPPVAMGTCFTFLYSLFVDFEFYYEQKRYVTWSTIASAALNILLNYIFIRIFGYYAAGYTTLVCYAVNAALHYYFMRKICRDSLQNVQPVDPRQLLGISGAFMGLGFLFLFTYRHAVLRYGLLALLIAAGFCARKHILVLYKQLLHVRQESK